MLSRLRAVWEWVKKLFGWKPGPTRTVEDYVPPAQFTVVDRFSDGSVVTRFGPTPDSRLAKRAFYKPVPQNAVREFRDGVLIRGTRFPDKE